MTGPGSSSHGGIMRAGLNVLPGSFRRWARLAAVGGSSLYEKLYERHAQAFPDDLAVGGKGEWEFDAIGRMELAILRAEGLEPKATLLDLGCGTGRLAVHAIPHLSSGRYIGVDISPTMIKRAAARVKAVIPRSGCEVIWTHQVSPRFPQADNSVDMVCAFSVFTHMEHEDTYLYLKEAHRIVRPGGRLIFSCLPLPLDNARKAFLREAEDGFKLRWQRVRSIATSIDMMTEIIKMAGWTLLHWYPGDEPIPALREGPGPSVFGQSVGVLQP